MHYKVQLLNYSYIDYYSRDEGSVDGSRNHLDLLLESTNQVEILESQFLPLFSIFPHIINYVMCYTLFSKQESQESIQESQNQAKIPESRRSKFRVADPSSREHCMHAACS